MVTDQQAEAFGYFTTHAKDWHEKAKTQDQLKFNVIQARNNYALQVIREREQTRSALDVGCGTGDLVCSLARLGIQATGVDFVQDMIDLAVETAQKQGVSGANFECASIFDFDFAAAPYDAIVANGFIEYIHQDDLIQFLQLVSGSLCAGGSFIVGSRNRLFNLGSLNDYTRMEMKGPDLEALLTEAIVLATGGLIEALTLLTPAKFQNPDIQHTRTNIDVETRFQYTPVQLMQMLADVGLKTYEIYPVHIHGVPPVFKNDYPQAHTSIANLLQSYGRGRLDLVPTASTFMIHAQKV